MSFVILLQTRLVAYQLNAQKMWSSICIALAISQEIRLNEFLDTVKLCLRPPMNNDHTVNIEHALKTVTDRLEQIYPRIETICQ